MPGILKCQAYKININDIKVCDAEQFECVAC